LYDALEVVPEADVMDACSDPKRTVSYPVYFVTRMDPTNAYHHFEEVNNLFAALWMYPHQELLQQVWRGRAGSFKTATSGRDRIRTAEGGARGNGASKAIPNPIILH
jgi:hypothetical protein